jgi:hypothetical protein
VTAVLGDLEEFFFRQEHTLHSLRQLADSSALVFYCGAGVSIDRTGLSWTQLVRSVYLNAIADKPHDTQSKSIGYLVEHLDDPRQVASVVVQAYRGLYDDNAFLSGILRKILYKESGWDRGLVLKNLTQLAIAAAISGRRVTIVTTNYDQFIEDELVKRIDGYIESGMTQSAPCVVRRKLDATEESQETVYDGEGETIEIIYLHGRVDERDGHVEGDIVLTEGSYALTTERSTKLLKEVFSTQDVAVLTIGASLTDEPLVHALSKTKTATEKRFALYTMPAALVDVASRPLAVDPGIAIDDGSVGRALNERGKHLGIELLRPVSYLQASQYLEELRISMTAADTSENAHYYAQDSSGISYAMRLNTWHAAWSTRSVVRDPSFPFGVLSDSIATIRGRINAEIDTRSKEKLRLEAWARMAPSSVNRTLTLWATSAGPLFDDSLYETAAVKQSTANASVQTFLSGRPRMLGLAQLSSSQITSRWRTFIGVPIFIEVPFDVQGNSNTGVVPVGVITLTSDRGLDDDQKSFFAEARTEVLNEIKGLMIAAGRRLFALAD